MSENIAVPAPRPSATQEQILVMLDQAGFVLSEPYLSEVISAYGYVQRLLSRIHRGYRFDEEPAHVFRPRTFEPRDPAG